MQNTTYSHYGNPQGMTYGVQMLLVSTIAIFIIDYFKIFPLNDLLYLRANWVDSFRVGVKSALSVAYFTQDLMAIRPSA